MAGDRFYEAASLIIALFRPGGRSHAASVRCHSRRVDWFDSLPEPVSDALSEMLTAMLPVAFFCGIPLLLILLIVVKVVTDRQDAQAALRYETATGVCADCHGKGRVWGYSHSRWSEHLGEVNINGWVPCKRCGGRGYHGRLGRR